jgi:hypothetical protein
LAVIIFHVVIFLLIAIERSWWIDSRSRRGKADQRVLLVSTFSGPG